MCRMLIYKKQLLIKFYQPVGAEHLPDDTVLWTGFFGKERNIGEAHLGAFSVSICFFQEFFLSTWLFILFYLSVITFRIFFGFCSTFIHWFWNHIINLFFDCVVLSDMQSGNSFFYRTSSIWNFCCIFWIFTVYPWITIDTSRHISRSVLGRILNRILCIIPVIALDRISHIIFHTIFC